MLCIRNYVHTLALIALLCKTPEERYTGLTRINVCIDESVAKVASHKVRILQRMNLALHSQRQNVEKVQNLPYDSSFKSSAMGCCMHEFYLV